jgi:hypothetical protein
VVHLFDIRADGTVVLRVHVQPGARRSGIAGVHGDALKVVVREPADRGRANEAVLAVVAAALGVGRRDVELVAGGTSRAKRIVVSGLGPEALGQRLGNVLASGAVARRHR